MKFLFFRFAELVAHLRNSKYLNVIPIKKNMRWKSPWDTFIESTKTGFKSNDKNDKNKTEQGDKIEH